MHHRTNIVIIGAGPAGAMLAYLLAKRGITVTLIERQHDFEREFRGEVLMPSGMDVFQQAGLAQPFAKVPQRELRRAVICDRSRTIFEIDLPRLLGHECSFTAVSQPAMLEMLVAEASQFPNFRFMRGTAMRDLVTEDDRVIGVEVSGGLDSRLRGNDESKHGNADEDSHKAGSTQVMADLVIGADGRASGVRKKSGLDAIRRPQQFDIVWCKVPPPEINTDAHTAHVFMGRGHFALAFPSYDDRLQIAWVIRKGAIGELRKQGVEHWVTEMANHVSPSLGAHLRANLNQITHPFLLDVICDLMPVWTRPGLLLIGDAAHPMSPVGGQGINIALRDAVVAANHLTSAAMRADAPLQGELDEAAAAVQGERMDEVRKIQRMQQFPPRLLFASALASTIVLRAAPLLMKTGLATPIVRAFMRRLAFGVTDVRLTDK